MSDVTYILEFTCPSSSKIKSSYRSAFRFYNYEQEKKWYAESKTIEPYLLMVEAGTRLLGPSMTKALRKDPAFSDKSLSRTIHNPLCAILGVFAITQTFCAVWGVIEQVVIENGEDRCLSSYPSGVLPYTQQSQSIGVDKYGNILPIAYVDYLANATSIPNIIPNSIIQQEMGTFWWLYGKVFEGDCICLSMRVK